MAGPERTKFIQGFGNLGSCGGTWMRKHSGLFERVLGSVLQQLMDASLAPVRKNGIYIICMNRVSIQRPFKLVLIQVSVKLVFIYFF